MNRKAKCSNCGEWYYNHNGLFISLPNTYDDAMCGNCNREIDDKIEGNSNKTQYISSGDK